MNIHQIECFLEVRKNLNFSRAAKQLYITQPALSYQIDSLENELGVRLFERTTTFVRLSEAGLAFAAPAEKLYNQYIVAFEAVHSYTDKKSSIVLACPHIMMMHDKIYPVLINRIVETFPAYDIEVRPLEKGMNLKTGLLRGIDCAIVIEPDAKEEWVEYYPLFGLRYHIVAAPRHILSGHKSVSLTELDRQTVYYEEGDQGYVEILQDIIKKKGVTVTLKAVTRYENVYPHIVSGNGVLISPVSFGFFPENWYILVKIVNIPQVVLMCPKEPNRSCDRILIKLIRGVYQEYMQEL